MKFKYKMIEHPDSIAEEIKFRQKQGMEPLTQEQMMTEGGKECLLLGIDIIKYKAALKEQFNAWLVADRLLGTSAEYSIHWAPYKDLRNWLRGTFPGMRIRSWPYGNWWVVHRMTFDPVTKEVIHEPVSLVLK